MDITYIQSHIEVLQQQLQKQKQLSLRLSYLRFALVVLAIFAIVQGQQQQWFYYVLLAVVALLFVFIAIRHMRLRKEMEDLEMLKAAYLDILARKGDEWKQFSDLGADFLQDDSRQEADLDIFGKASLFQYLNCAKTGQGRAYLAQLFTWKKPTAAAILQRQQAVKECVQQEEFTMKFVQLSKLYERHGAKRKQQQMEAFFAYMEDSSSTYPPLFRTLCTMVSAATLATLLASMVWGLSYVFFLVLFMGSMCTALLFLMKNMQVMAPVSTSARIMQDYARMLQHLHITTFHGDYMQELQAACRDALQAIRQLQHILQLVQVRNNFIMNFIVNGLFLLDFQCVYALEQWKRQYGGHVRTWLEAVGKCEAIVSLAQLSYAKKQVCFGDILQQDAPHVHFTAMHHPLLCEEKAVSNSFDAQAKTYILTGSNMSGKTTFLRTIGVNMVLFHAGSAVCASHAQATPLHIYTSMRVRDDVSEGISTFYAEILRIRDMMHASERKEAMLVLIDEIFKGTNSADRIVCALTAMKRLHLPWVISMVSTHDFELCDLEKELSAENYHFSEYYEDERICFDYTLKHGRCTTTNARQLMKLAGFGDIA